MGRMLVCKDGDNKVLPRDMAFKFKSVDFTGVENCKPFRYEDEGGVRKAVPDFDGDEDPVYTLITKEIGLYAMSAGLKTRMSITFCDDGYMVADIIDGAVIVRPDDKAMLASRGLSSVPNINLDDVLWIDAEKLLSNRELWDIMGTYYQDFEFMFELSGERVNGMMSFKLRLDRDSSQDISGGEIERIKEERRKFEESRAAKKSFDMVSQAAHKSGYEFEDDEEENEYEEDGYYEDDEYFGDGSR